MTRGLFITGTDTGVGKTAITSALLTVLRARGVDAVPMKPIQTGCLKRGGEVVAPDLDHCLRAIKFNPTVAEAEWMCPYRFVPACSPHLAARLARRPIQLRSLSAAFRQLVARHDFVLVEGAGGVFTPLGGGRSMLDMMRTLGLPALVVARPGLGTLNHTLLTLAALRAAQVPIAGVMLCATRPGRRGQVERDNYAALVELGQVELLGRLPFIRAAADFRKTVERFARDWTLGPPFFPALGKRRP